MTAAPSCGGVLDFKVATQATFSAGNLNWLVVWKIWIIFPNGWDDDPI